MRGRELIVRILIWSLSDSSTTIGELEDALPELDPPNAWIWNDVNERFGVIVHGDEVPAAVGEIREFIGEDADVYEEFDVLEA